MIEFTDSLLVNQPPEVAFELLADMADLHRWNPNVTTSELVAGERLKEGALFVSTIKRGPIRMKARSELVQVVPDQMVEYAGSISFFWSVDSLYFEAADGGTRITFRNNTTTPRLLRWLDRLLNRMFQPQARRALQGAASYLAES